MGGLNLNFRECDTTCVIIGNNGTGKTNILEAISSIFSVIYSNSDDFSFGFVLRYEIDDNVFRIKHTIRPKVTEYQKNNNPVNKTDMEYPSRIICNYSGEDLRLWDNYYRKPYEDYMKNVRTANASNTLSMVYIDKSMWKYILLCMLVARGDNDTFNDFLKDKLHIPEGGVDRIELKIDTAKLAGWQKNQITTFISHLQGRINKGSVLRSTDPADFNPDNDESHDLFNKFVGSSQVIRELSIFFNNGVESAYLSEGEKKMMVVLFILEAIADERTIVLMDEPDSHIHVSRKAELVKMFNDTQNRSNIITSHSPTLTAALQERDKKSIIMLETKNGLSNVIDKNTVDLVAHLTGGSWSAHRLNLFLASHDDILLLEGPSDETYIKTALKYFKDNKKYNGLSFEYLPCGGASNVKNFADKFKPKDGQTIIAFFDGDKAGVGGINKIVNYSDKEWDVETFGKARKQGNVWYSFYPPYARRKKKANFNIEDYFTCKLLRQYTRSCSTLEQIKTGVSGIKDQLHTDCQKGIIKGKYYEKFSTLFDHILAIKDADRKGLTEL
ncbi:MAG: ATP-binding protein [Clostridia bacterium]|nr:ATP-binding protein [Clostridia bacterium]